MKKKCGTCKHGPNPDLRLFKTHANSGCGRIEKIDKVFEELGEEHQKIAEELSSNIIEYLQRVHRGQTDSKCGGWQ